MPLPLCNLPIHELTVRTTIMPPLSTIEAGVLETELQRIICDHFRAAHGRVPAVYQANFASGTAIFRRHWENKRDIPQDFLSLPKTAYRVFHTAFNKVRASTRTKSALPQKLSGKEAALLRIIQQQLLQIEALGDKLLQKTREFSPDIIAIETLTKSPLSPAEKVQIEQFLSQRIQSFTLPRDGSRDLLLFLTIGILGKGLGQKVAFGSSIATGAALAQSLYLSQQSWWGAIWLSWAGTPGWVSVMGATGGIALTLVLAPVISPLAEMLINRTRGEKHLHQLIDQVEKSTLRHRTDNLDIAGMFASYAQLAPDLLQLLKSFRG